MTDVRPQRPPAPIDVLDRVLGKGVVITPRHDLSDTRGNVSIAGIRLLGVISYVVIADLDDGPIEYF